MSHRSHFLTAVIAIATLLFAQLAVAAYACPAYLTGQTASAADRETRAMPDCVDAETGELALCHSHCLQGAQSFDKPGAQSIPPVIAAGFITVSADRQFLFDLSPSRPRAYPLARSTEPPLFVRNCCFRI